MNNPTGTHIQNPQRRELGFTLLELLAALTLTSVLMTMVVSHILEVHEVYFSDAVRTRINSNLRSSMDILSMNIRQAGENLPSSFPVVAVTDGTSGASDQLLLRRSVVPEVLTVCLAVNIGDVSIKVSNTALSNQECIASNVAQSHTAFQNYRTDNGGSVRAFIYNQTTKTGEFLTYTAGGTTSGNYYLTTSATAAAYPVLTSNIYLLEEYKFVRDASTNKFQVYVNGDHATARTVAFSVTAFDVLLRLTDGTTATALSTTSTFGWRDISQIQVSLAGQEKFKKRIIKSSITSQYFPRNVLSYDN